MDFVDSKRNYLQYMCIYLHMYVYVCVRAFINTDSFYINFSEITVAKLVILEYQINEERNWYQ